MDLIRVPRGTALEAGRGCHGHETIHPVPSPDTAGGCSGKLSLGVRAPSGLLDSVSGDLGHGDIHMSASRLLSEKLWLEVEARVPGVHAGSVSCVSPPAQNGLSRCWQQPGQSPALGRGRWGWCLHFQVCRHAGLPVACLSG